MSFKHVSESQIQMSQLMLPSHSNFSGKIHGGYILNVMDQVAFACGSKHSGNYCVTASVNTVDFLAPIEVGELVTFKASVNFTGRTSMIVGLRVEAQNIRTGEIKHCNSSYFTMVAKNEDGNNVEVPGLILDSVEAVRRFTRSIQRQEQSQKRRNAFKENEFVLEDHLTDIEGQNAKLDLPS